MKHISSIEISLIYFAWLMFSEKALTGKDKHNKDDKGNASSTQSEHYTIFHALFDALKEKDKKHKKR